VRHLPISRGRFGHAARPAMATLLVTVVAAAMLSTAGLTTGFTRDLLLNLGASLAFVPPTYLVFAPVFERLRQTAAAIHEHTRLDRDQVIAGIRGGRWIVEAMVTWSSLLEEPHRAPFLDALSSALRHGAVVRILLLNPDSFAVAQRTRELDGLDVRLLIGANLRHLYALGRQLDPAPRRGLEVRLYDASPSMQLFRWDERVLISFFPLHQRVAAARQIETYVSNPLGEFAQSRFEELWAADTTRGIEEYMRVLVSIRNSADVLATERVGFVRHLDQLFVDATPFVAHLVRHGIAGLRASLPDLDGGSALAMSQVESCPPEQRHDVFALFERKYGDPPSQDVIVRLG
jgi:hypothetical protein